MLNNFFTASFLLMVGLSLPLWITAFLRWNSGTEVLPLRKSAPSPLGFVDVILIFLFWMVGQIAALNGFLACFNLSSESLGEASGSQEAWLSIFTAFGALAGVGLGLSIIAIRYRSLDAIGWNPRFLWEDILLGCKTFVMVVPAVLIIQLLLARLYEYNHSTLEMIRQNGTGLTIGASWFAAGLVAPICEEVFFRGILQAWMQRLGKGSDATTDEKMAGGWGDSERQMLGRAPRPGRKIDPLPSKSQMKAPIFWPIFVTAALFGLTHLGQGAAPIPLVLFGLALGYIFRKTGAILPCIVCHMMLNAFSLFWFTMGVITEAPEPESATAWIQWGGGLDCFF